MCEFYSMLCFLNFVVHQRHILSLDGPVVTAAGYKDELAVVTHISPSLPSDEQVSSKFSVDDPLVEKLAYHASIICEFPSKFR